MMPQGWLLMFLLAYIVGFYVFHKTVDVWLSALAFAATQIAMVGFTVYLFG